MKFGVREICDVVLKAKFPHKVGNKMFYKDEPVLFFDSLKTSTLEGASTTVYAQGGRGNARLVAWEGDRTVTFTMEDALISPESFSVLSGAGIVDGNATDNKIYQHIVETREVTFTGTTASDVAATAELSFEPVIDNNYMVCVLGKDDYDNIITEPFYCKKAEGETKKITIGVAGARTDYTDSKAGLWKWHEYTNEYEDSTAFDLENDTKYYALIDYYTIRTKGKLIEITPDKFGGNYYLEASTLFRDSANGKDYPAEFIIPNCRIQSNFTFNMANSGDPSTFTFTIDAFPDYTKFDRTKKVFAAIQIIDDIGLIDNSGANYRTVTPAP